MIPLFSHKLSKLTFEHRPFLERIFYNIFKFFSNIYIFYNIIILNVFFNRLHKKQ